MREELRIRRTYGKRRRGLRRCDHQQHDHRRRAVVRVRRHSCRLLRLATNNQKLLKMARLFATKSTKGTEINLKTIKRFPHSHVLFVPFVAKQFSGLSGAC
jgi:hypothetical protein